MENIFGHYLRETRLKRQLSIRQLSAKSGLSTSHISNVENGTRLPPCSGALNLLANALCLSSVEKAKFFYLAIQSKSKVKDIPGDLLVYI